MVVDTTLANLWTSPESPRLLDQPVLTNPIELEAWLNAMSYDERLALCTDNLVQSQVLYGTEVEVIQEQGKWAEVVVPDQPSIKDERGYPGWMALDQLRTAPEEYNVTRVAVVNRPTAIIYNTSLEQERTVSFQTRLPLKEEQGDWVFVHTPSGIRQLRREDVFMEQAGDRLDVSGTDIIHAGEQFLGLPYLWGGMSGFGYDCSGFAYMMHRSVGRIIPRDASNQALDGQIIEQNDLQPGDLMFFAYEQGKGAIHHVGIFYDDGRMIHAPKTGKAVEIITLAGFEYENEFCGARRYW